MAMYKDRGYCPAFMLKQFSRRYPAVSEHWEETQKLLGSRTQCMFYEEGGVSNEGYYICDVLACGSGLLGIKIAVTLQIMMPVCINNEFGRPIVITDNKTLEQVPSYVSLENDEWKVRQIPENFCGVKRFVRRHVEHLTVAVLNDKRYLVVIEDDGKEIHMDIYKKTWESPENLK